MARIRPISTSATCTFARRDCGCKTRWYFEPGTELSVNFQLADQPRDGGGRMLKTEGVVVDCERDRERRGLSWLRWCSWK